LVDRCELAFHGGHFGRDPSRHRQRKQRHQSVGFDLEDPLQQASRLKRRQLARLKHHSAEPVRVQAKAPIEVRGSLSDDTTPKRLPLEISIELGRIEGPRPAAEGQVQGGGGPPRHPGKPVHWDVNQCARLPERIALNSANEGISREFCVPFPAKLEISEGLIEA
jgi:hypothetical protein